MNKDNTGVVGNNYGIEIVNSSTNTTIGGTNAAARNIISGNAVIGVYIVSSTADIEGNYIGTDATGIGGVVPGNAGGGVYASFSSVTVGGLTATPGTGAGNVISGNGGAGIKTVQNTAVLIEGNIFGLDATGKVAVGNVGAGVELAPNYGVEVSAGPTVGGIASGARNIISGNAGNGISFDGEIAGYGVQDAVVEGNYIGTDISGTVALGNTGEGIEFALTGDTFGNTIGGAAAGAANVISGNARMASRLMAAVPTSSKGT